MATREGACAPRAEAVLSLREDQGSRDSACIGTPLALSSPSLMANQHKLLLLDDDEQILELYQELLQTLPSQPEVHVSNSGARAIALLESEPFSLLITDLRMPKMDGLSLISVIRADHADLPIIIFTGLGYDEEMMQAARVAGANGYVSKGLGPSEIYSAVMRVLNTPVNPPAPAAS